MVSAFFPQPTKGLRTSDVECAEFPHHRNWLWRMWGRMLAKCMKGKWQRHRETYKEVSPELWNVSPLLRPDAEEASSNRATQTLTFTHSCSCFLLTSSSPGNLLFLSPSSPSLPTPYDPAWVCPEGLCCAGYGFMTETPSVVAVIQRYHLCSFWSWFVSFRFL